MKIRVLIGLVGLGLALTTYADTSFTPNPVNHWQIGVRILNVVPSASSIPLNPIGGNVRSISSDVVPELDINYYFTNHISTELILGTTKNYVYADSLSGSNNLGSVKLLPPTLTGLYHFFPDSIVSPYLGAGLNYTTFYDVQNGPGLTNTTYSDSFGPVLQAGMNVNLGHNFALNFDVKKVFISTDFSTQAGATTVTTNVKIDPVIYGMGLNYRF